MEKPSPQLSRETGYVLIMLGGKSGEITWGVIKGEKDRDCLLFTAHLSKKTISMHLDVFLQIQ